MNIYVLNTLASGIEIIETINESMPIQGIIGLDENVSNKNISGFANMSNYCKEKNLHFIPVSSYSMNSENDRQKLVSNEIDVLIVAGWQRLIPEWLIVHCSECVIGIHGSHDGIEGGRGRAPQNWALILGKKNFFISIFKITPEADSGDIIDTRSFELHEYDDVQSSYYKTSALAASMIVEALKKKSWLNAEPQNNSNARYLPQRLPEDGEIDWKRNASDIYNFVRALTNPFPGAFSRYEKGIIRIWRGIPLSFPSKNLPGTILKIFPNNDFLVQTGNEAFLVREYEIETESKSSQLQKGLCLNSADFRIQMKKIIERHYSKYPDHLLSDDILKAGL